MGNSRIRYWARKQAVTNNSFLFHESQRFLWYETKLSHYHIIALSVIPWLSSGNLCRNQLNQGLSLLISCDIIGIESRWISTAYARGSRWLQHVTSLEQNIFGYNNATYLWLTNSLIRSCHTVLLFYTTRISPSFTQSVYYMVRFSISLFIQYMHFSCRNVYKQHVR
jgi:hypothetical protein